MMILKAQRCAKKKGENMETSKMSFIVACKKFFGMKIGQSLTDFANEIKAISDKEKAELTHEFQTVGIEITK